MGVTYDAPLLLRYGLDHVDQLARQSLCRQSIRVFTGVPRQQSRVDGVLAVRVVFAGLVLRVRREHFQLRPDQKRTDPSRRAVQGRVFTELKFSIFSRARRLLVS